LTARSSEIYTKLALELFCRFYYDVRLLYIKFGAKFLSEMENFYIEA